MVKITWFLRDSHAYINIRQKESDRGLIYNRIRIAQDIKNQRIKKLQQKKRCYQTKQKYVNQPTVRPWTGTAEEQLTIEESRDDS